MPRCPDSIGRNQRRKHILDAEGTTPTRRETVAYKAIKLATPDRMTINMAGKISSLLRNKFTNEVVRRMKSTSVFIPPNLESSFNAQINAELFSGYTYLAMANYFGRQCVALPGCRAFYMDQVKEEEDHARKLMDFVVQRGGRVILRPVQEPVQQEWDSPLTAFKQALALELDISQKLLTLHEECHSCCDLFACNILENDFLDEQVESVDKLTRYIAQMERMGCEGLAIYLFDQFLLRECKKVT